MPLTVIVAVALAFILFYSYLFFGPLIRSSTVPKSHRASLDFSDVPPLPSFDISKTEPQPYRPWKAGKFNMTMGLRKMPERDWLIIDNLYEKEQQLKRHLLETKYHEVLQCLPTAETACEEALECIVQFLTRRYPSHFMLLRDKPGYIFNAITNRIFKVTSPYEVHPLEIAAQLSMEDINILVRGTGETAQNYHLQASFSMAPVGWSIKQRIGWPLWKIHGPVPMWNHKLRPVVEKFFLGLQVSSPVQRNSYFIQTGNTMFHPEPLPEVLPSPPKIEDIHIRHERQTLRRLPRTGAVLFMVRTYLTPLVDLREEKDNLYALYSAISSWPLEMAKYKGKAAWGEVLGMWCTEVLADYVPEDQDQD